MKKFYLCPKCGESFCLKGRKWCEECGDMICKGQGKNPHEPTKMTFVGYKYQDLVEARK